MEDPVVGGYTPEKVALRRAHRRWRSTSTARSGSCAAARRSRRSRRWCRNTIGYDPALQEREQRLRPGARQGAARPVRLRRPRRRRLARPARRLAAGARSRHPARPAVAPARRAVAEGHGRARRAADVQAGQVAREPEDRARRQADDVERRLVGRRARRRAVARPRLQPATGRPEPGALQERRVRRRSTTGCRCCPTARSGSTLFAQAKKILRRLHAVQDTACTACYTDLAWPWLIGYRRPLFWQRLVAVRRHRHRGAGEGERSEAARRSCRAAPALAATAGDRPAVRAARPRASARSAGPSTPPRPASTRRRSPTCTRTTSSPTSSSRRCSYDYLARPAEAASAHRGRDAGGVRTTSARFTVRIRPGIFFADDPAFKGQKRELTAHDYVYAIKRDLRPALEEPAVLVARHLEAARPGRAAQAGAGHRHSSTTTARSKACVRSTATRSRSGWPSPSPRFSTTSPTPRLRRGRARGGRDVRRRHRWRTRSARDPSSWPSGGARRRIVLERNPNLPRASSTTRRPPADDAAGAGDRGAAEGPPPAAGRPRRDLGHRRVAAALAVVPERRARLRRTCRSSSSTRPCPTARSRRTWRKQGMRARSHHSTRTSSSRYFNMDDPMVGGYTPEKVALRRAISLGYDIGEEIRLVRNGSMLPAQSPVPPGVIGYDAGFRSEMSQLRPARRHARCSTCTATSTATATAGASSPTARRSCSRWRASRASSTAASTRCGSAT